MRSSCPMFVLGLVTSMVAAVVPDMARAGVQFAGTASGAFLKIDAATGAVTVVNPNVGHEFDALALDPISGVLYGLGTVLGNERLFTVDQATGITTQVVGDIGPGVSTMDFSASGVLYVADRGGFVELSTLDKTTGALTLINPNVGTDMAGITFDNTGTLWGGSKPSNGGPIFAINPADGSLSYLTFSSPGVAAMTYDAGADKLYGVFGTEWSEISRVNGSVTTINASLGYSITALAAAPAGSALIPGDLDGDTDVDLTDYGILKGHWQQNVGGIANGDLNGDVKVNIIDFAIFKQDYITFNGGGGGDLPVPVPEPSAWLLLTAALPAWFFVLRRTRPTS